MGAYRRASAGSTAGGSTWEDPAFWTVVFTGVPSLDLSRPGSLVLGSLTLTNLQAVERSAEGLYKANLELTVHFASPGVDDLSFDYELGLLAESRKRKGDTLDLTFSALPAPRTFTVGDAKYKLSYDGFFSSRGKKSDPLDYVSVTNRKAGKPHADSVDAYLWGTITREGSPTTGASVAPVPEPASAVFLGTVAAFGLWRGLRRPKRV